MCQQLTCNSCKRTKNKLSRQLTLDVQVKGFEDIETSIKSQIAGEDVDLKCDSCGAENKMFKKSDNFATTPNMLIVKLNRLAFDNISGEMRKVNSRCTFPPELSLKDYYYHNIMNADKKSKFNEQKQIA